MGSENGGLEKRNLLFGWRYDPSGEHVILYIMGPFDPRGHTCNICLVIVFERH